MGRPKLIKERKKAGRKLFDGKPYDDVVRKLETAWALRCSDVEAAHFAEISRSALQSFLEKNPHITARKEQLKNRPVLLAKQTIVTAIGSDPKIAIDYLERVTDDFTPKHKVEHSTPEDRAFRIEVVDASNKDK